MVKKTLVWIVLLLLLGAPLVLAQTLDDAAGIFENPTQVEQLLKDYETKLGFPIFIVTTRDRAGMSVQTFADTQLVERVGPNQNGAVLIVDMATRDMYISVSGDAFDESKVKESQLTKIIDQVASALSAGDYDKAAATFAKGVQSAVEGNKLTLLDYLLSLGAGSASSLGFVGAQKRKYRRKPIPKPFALLQNANLVMAATQDQLIDTSRQVTRIPKADSGGGKSSRHSGPGGGSFRGGGKKF